MVNYSITKANGVYVLSNDLLLFSTDFCDISIIARSRLHPAWPSEDLPLMGREESEVCFQSASRL